MGLLVSTIFRSVTCRKYTRSLYYRAVPTNSQTPQSTVEFPQDTVGKSHEAANHTAN